MRMGTVYQKVLGELKFRRVNTHPQKHVLASRREGQGRINQSRENAARRSATYKSNPSDHREKITLKSISAARKKDGWKPVGDRTDTRRYVPEKSSSFGGDEQIRA